MTELKGSDTVDAAPETTEEHRKKPASRRAGSSAKKNAATARKSEDSPAPVEENAAGKSRGASAKSPAKRASAKSAAQAKASPAVPEKITAGAAPLADGGNAPQEDAPAAKSTARGRKSPAKTAEPQPAAKGSRRQKTVTASEDVAEAAPQLPGDGSPTREDTPKTPAKRAKSTGSAAKKSPAGRKPRSATSDAPAGETTVLPVPETATAAPHTSSSSEILPESTETPPTPKARGPRSGPGRPRSKAVTAAAPEDPLERPAAPQLESAPEEERRPAPLETETLSSPEAATAPAKVAEPEQEAARRAEAAEPAVPAAIMDFPSGFGDTGPEDVFASLDQEDDGASEEEGESAGTDTVEKKRRGRSRRGGRGRKKASAQSAAAETTPQPAAGTLPEDSIVPAALETPDHSDDFLPDDEDESPPAGHISFLDEDEDEAAPGKVSAAKASRRKMFVSVLPEEQVEVVITEEGQVQEYYVEMLHQAKTKGNIYKGIVHNVDPNLQAAFVTYGAVKNGFLQIDEVHPEYYVSPHDSTKSRKYPPIQKVLKSGQELLVQVVKEPAGTKGAFLTTYLSMPGRFLVLTPGREQIGVSRKVESETERARLRELLEGLSPGPGLGVIVRTVSMGASKTSLQRDLQFLKRTWKDVRTRGTTDKAPCLVYQEMDLTSRAVRDYLTENIGEVWIDDENTCAAVTEIAEALFPRKQNFVRLHKESTTPLFERFNLQKQLDQIHSREVSLPSGGRLVIDPTEALTAIDINSGRSSGKNNFEDMAYRTNMEAAKMIPLQLRLRDIGGQVVADFIEMRDKNHWRDVEKTLRNGMKVDRARYDVGKIGPFGMLEMVRQRLGSSAISVSTEPCPCCNGTGVRRNMEWQSQHALRDILRLLRNAQANNESAVTYAAEQPLAMHLLNHKRQRLLDMEQRYGARLDILVKVSAE